MNQDLHRHFSDVSEEAHANSSVQLEAWDSLVEGDATQERYLTPVALSVLTAPQRSVRDHLSDMLAAGPINGEQLRLVLEGTEGLKVAAQVLSTRLRADYPEFYSDDGGE